jgi:hypothetical protein
MNLKFAEWQGGPSTVQMGQQPIYIPIENIMGLYTNNIGFCTGISVKFCCECKTVYVSGTPEMLGPAISRAREGNVSQDELDELSFHPVTTRVSYPMDDPEFAARHMEWEEEMRASERAEMRRKLSWLGFQRWRFNVWRKSRPPRGGS